LVFIIKIGVEKTASLLLFKSTQLYLECRQRKDVLKQPNFSLFVSFCNDYISSEKGKKKYWPLMYLPATKITVIYGPNVSWDQDGRSCNIRPHVDVLRGSISSLGAIFLYDHLI